MTAAWHAAKHMLFLLALDLLLPLYCVQSLPAVIARVHACACVHVSAVLCAQATRATSNATGTGLQAGVGCMHPLGWMQIACRGHAGKQQLHKCCNAACEGKLHKESLQGYRPCQYLEALLSGPT